MPQGFVYVDQNFTLKLACRSGIEIVEEVLRKQGLTEIRRVTPKEKIKNIYDLEVKISAKNSNEALGVLKLVRSLSKGNVTSTCVQSEE